MTKPMTVIVDFTMEYHPETGWVHVNILNQDAEYEEVATIETDSPPLWSINGIENEEKDYQNWYNDTIDLLHKMGYCLEGEVDSI